MAQSREAPSGQHIGNAISPIARPLLVLYGVPAQAPSAHQPWLYVTQSQNTAVQCGLDPATQISSTPNFIVQCAWFQAVCIPRSSHGWIGCQCSAMLQLLLHVIKQQLTTCFKSTKPLQTGLCIWCLWASTSTTWISAPNTARHDICRHNYAAERGLFVGFCGQPHYCYRPYYLTARFRSPSPYMVSDEPFPNRWRPMLC